MPRRSDKKVATLASIFDLAKIALHSGLTMGLISDPQRQAWRTEPFNLPDTVSIPKNGKERPF